MATLIKSIITSAHFDQSLFVDIIVLAIVFKHMFVMYSVSLWISNVNLANQHETTIAKFWIYDMYL